jgi:hypothetical protein
MCWVVASFEHKEACGNRENVEELGFCTDMHVLATLRRRGPRTKKEPVLISND